MEKEFVTYELALRMKQLGFDEPCLAYYVETEFTATSDAMLFLINRNDTIIHNNSTYLSNDIYEGVISAPLFQQVFRWFREKYDLLNDIGISASRRNDINKWMYSIIYLDRNTYTHSEKTYNTYEEAELACLKKIIEIVEQKNKKDETN
jgi:hypothetical protein